MNRYRTFCYGLDDGEVVGPASGSIVAMGVGSSGLRVTIGGVSGRGNWLIIVGLEGSSVATGEARGGLLSVQSLLESEGISTRTRSPAGNCFLKASICDGSIRYISWLPSACSTN